MVAYFRTLSLFSRDVWLYLLTSALVGLGYFGFVTVLLNLYLLRLGYGPEFIGLVNGSTAIAFAASSLPAGAIGSRWGYRRTVVSGICLVSLGIMILPIGEFLPSAWRDTGVIITRLFSGLGFALYTVNANPYLVAATSPQERNHVFSMQVAVLPLAGFFGSLVAGMLPEFVATLLNVSLEHPAPYRYPLISSGIFILPAAFALLTTREIIKQEETQTTTRETAFSIERQTLIIIAILSVTMMFRTAGEGAARSFFNVYLDDGLGISTARIGFLTAIGQLLAGPTALATPLIVMRTGKMPAIIYGSIGIVLSLLLMGLIPHWLSAGIGYMGVLGMLSITRSVINVVQMEIVRPEWRSITSGVTSMCMGIGFSSMALGGGYIITAAGYRALFLIGASVVSVSVFIFWLFFRVPRGEYAKTSY